ncbi:2-nitropropane dioxygenase [Ceratobasidium sp. AG-I]|nr:2-nitropropane dioxygenase [Ceratobasidium sp. AG-I]
MPGPIVTPLTKLFGIDHPIILAGMNVAAGPALAAAVTNAGGLGVIGGIGYTPKVLRDQLRELKKDLKDKNAPFGVDLLLPQVGGSARKTNYDYTKGQLPELIDVIIEEKAALFVSAVGVPPKEVVERLHKAGIPVMNMVGHPKHVARALEAGVDLICAQGGEGGGHTGDVPSSILIPACVDAVKGHKSSLNGNPIYVVAAGGIYDGRGLAANLMYGAQAVWVGTRFVASEEAGAPKRHKELIVSAGHEDIARTLIYTGRPLRVRKTPYVADWEDNRREEIKELTTKGIIPNEHEMEKHPEKSLQARTFLMGSVSAVIHDVLPAKTIVDNMVKDAVERIQSGNGLLATKAKL